MMIKAILIMCLFINGYSIVHLSLITTEESKARYLKLGFQEIHDNKLHLEICNLSVYKK